MTCILELFNKAKLHYYLHFIPLPVIIPVIVPVRPCYYQDRKCYCWSVVMCAVLIHFFCWQTGQLHKPVYLYFLCCLLSFYICPCPCFNTWLGLSIKYLRPSLPVSLEPIIMLPSWSRWEVYSAASGASQFAHLNTVLVPPRNTMRL